MLQRLYRRTLALSASRRAPWWLAAVAFAESSFFPIPPDALLVPMALARPERAFRFAAICTVASVSGRRARVSDRLCAVHPVGRAADSLLRLRASFRGVPRDVRRVGLVGDSHQGTDAHTLQNRDDRVGRGRVQLPGVHGGERA